jgi:uncharacterized Tic20 family protein/DNA-binding transcriptional regulator YiaG
LSQGLNGNPPIFVPKLKNKKMKNNDLAQKVKTLRNRKGYSQEELSEKTGLSLRTIQRIENGETEPRGDTLKRLAMVFDVSPDEMVDWAVQEDKGFLVSFNLSALSFLVLPLGGILVPLIIWISKKDKIKGVNDLAKNLLNFQITWLILLFLGFPLAIFLLPLVPDSFLNQPGAVALLWIFLVIILCVYNLVLIVVNSIRINKGKPAVYFPAIPFLKK